MNALPESKTQRTLRIVDFEPTEASERQRLEQLWLRGNLQRHLASLNAFFREKADELRSLLENEFSHCRPVDIAKLMVIESGIVDRIAETLDQIREIEAEIWIQGERGNHDRSRIAYEWSQQHAEGWRQWRLKEYLYAIERMGLPFQRQAS